MIDESVLRWAETNIYHTPAKRIGTQVRLRFDPDDPTVIGVSQSSLMVVVGPTVVGLFVGLMIIDFAGS